MNYELFKFFANSLQKRTQERNTKATTSLLKNNCRHDTSFPQKGHVPIANGTRPYRQWDASLLLTQYIDVIKILLFGFSTPPEKSAKFSAEVG